ncbi:hypothetical protein V6N12_005465 [Hibiscus sabdariffa]|uniref:Kazal-like domain-containing protein n=1 Tax=Hibiscus sabdariffa TaxID=183260 RepID=A0ABR2B6Z3_9ROSI
MNKFIALPILCGLLLLALFSPCEGQIKFCPTTLDLAGQCGPNFKFDCFTAIDAKFGASAMTQSPMHGDGVVSPSLDSTRQIN